MQELERQMLQYQPAEDEQFELNILAQLAIAHAQFETIHPYKDGNGRTGRLLMPLILAAEGYPPLYLSGALLRSKDAYYDALNQVQLKGNWAPWMDMVSKAVVESANDAIAIAEDMQQLVAAWSERVSGYRADAVARRLPALLVGHPVVTAAQVASLLGVSNRSALTGIYALEKEAILATGNERKWGTDLLRAGRSRPPQSAPVAAPPTSALKSSRPTSALPIRRRRRLPNLRPYPSGTRGRRPARHRRAGVPWLPVPHRSG